MRNRHPRVFCILSPRCVSIWANANAKFVSRQPSREEAVRQGSNKRKTKQIKNGKPHPSPLSSAQRLTHSKRRRTDSEGSRATQTDATRELSPAKVAAAAAVAVVLSVNPRRVLSTVQSCWCDRPTGRTPTPHRTELQNALKTGFRRTTAFRNGATLHRCGTQPPLKHPTDGKE